MVSECEIAKFYEFYIIYIRAAGSRKSGFRIRLGSTKKELGPYQRRLDPHKVGSGTDLDLPCFNIIRSGTAVDLKKTEEKFLIKIIIVKI